MIHPLSGKVFEHDPTADITRYSLEEIMKVAEKAMKNVARVAGSNDKSRFLVLWRNIIPFLEKESAGILKKYWGIAPADTRIPDHSIFEHVKIASTCVSSGWIQANILLTNASLFIFSLGPVQSFIAQARKTQDLYWGSYILSYLTWKAIESIADMYGPDSIIFPDINGQPQCDLWLERNNIHIEQSNSSHIINPTIPNRFMAIVPESDQKNISSLGQRLEEIVSLEFERMSEAVIKELRCEKPACFHDQIKSFLQIYWTAVPLPRDDEGRHDWENALQLVAPFFKDESLREKRELINFIMSNSAYRPNIGTVYNVLVSFAEKTLGAIKNVRPFSQLAEAGRKCSLCGERNVLFYRMSDNEVKGNRKADELKKRKLFNTSAVVLDRNFPQKYLQLGEGLCAVCFTKRCAEKYFLKGYNFAQWPEFPSIATIAQKNILRAIENDPEFIAYTQYFENEDRSKLFEPQLLYEENINNDYLRKNGILINASIDTIKNAHKKLSKKWERSNLKQTKYYAVIMLDGDNMGKWLSGEFAPYIEKIYHPRVWENIRQHNAAFASQVKEKRRPLTPALHAAISTALKEYSLTFVKQIVEEYGSGKLVYAGGDDVLAFVPLETLLDVMIKLRAAFSGHVTMKDNDMLVNFDKDVSGFVDIGNRILITMGPNATASTGVCIAHYKTPLGEAIAAARRMEKKAKEHQREKDSFAICVMKHSGEIIETVHGWRGVLLNEERERYPEGTIALLKRLIAHLSNGEFTSTYLFHIREEFYRFMSYDSSIDRTKKVSNEIILSELKRLLSRSCQISGRDEKEKERKRRMIDELHNDLFDLFTSTSLENFISFNEVALFITRETTI